MTTKQEIQNNTKIDLLNYMLVNHKTSISEKELFKMLTEGAGIKLIIRNGVWARARYENGLWV